MFGALLWREEDHRCHDRLKIGEISARLSANSSFPASGLHINSSQETTYPVLSASGSSQGAVTGAVHDTPNGGVHTKHFISDKAFPWWGQWVAAVSPTSNQLLLVRDELGREPLFYARCREGIVFSTRLADVTDCITPHPSLDWDYLTYFAATGQIKAGSTPFEGVHSVPQSSIVTLTAKTTHTRHHWDPFLSSSTRDPIHSKNISDVLCASVERWILPHDRVALQFSGGLDSSAVAWAAREVGKTITPVHMQISGFNHVDEKDYAQCVANSLGMSLIVQERTPGEMVANPERSLHRPDLLTDGIVYCGAFEHLRDFCDSQSLLLTGGGGDQVFFVGAERPFHLHEILRARGITAAWNELLECSTHGFGSVWTLSKEFLRNEIRTRRGNKALIPHVTYKEPLAEWVNISLPNVEKAQQEEIKRLLGESRSCTPAELTHIMTVLSTTHQVDANPRWVLGIGLTLPLLSRPLVDLLFRTPITSLWDGRSSRKSIRAALAGKLPDMVVNRTTKAVFDGVYHAGWKEHEREATQLVGEGVLAKNGIINKEEALTALRRYLLSGDSTASQGLTHLLSAERWLRAWGYSS